MIVQLPVLDKVLDALINLELVQNHNLYGLLSDKQYGFRFSRYVANALTTINKLETLDKNDKAQLVTIDISKAFDRLERC